jgi:hypothetical protein
MHYDSSSFEPLTRTADTCFVLIYPESRSLYRASDFLDETVWDAIP